MEPVTLALAIGSVLGGFALLNKQQQQEATPQSEQEQTNESPDLLTSVLSGNTEDIVSGVISEIGQVIEDPNHLNVILFGVDKEAAREAADAARLSFQQQVAAGVADRVMVDYMLTHPLTSSPPTSVFQSVVASINLSGVKLGPLEVAAVTNRYTEVYRLFSQSTEGKAAITRVTGV